MEHQTHFLSIVIPLFNSGKYIERCICSILELRLPKEIIVVDDGSTDNSCKKLEGFVKSGDIKLFRQPNKGVSEARNRALQECKGDIIAFVDSDDYILRDNFETLYKSFAQTDAEMAMGGTSIIFPDGRTEIRLPHEQMHGRFYNGQDCFSELSRTNTFSPLVFCYFFRKSFITRNKMSFRHRMSEDDLWTTIAMCRVGRVYIGNCPHYVYCKHEESITGRNAETLFKADCHSAVSDDLYRFLTTSRLAEDTQAWLCCKILYIMSSAVNIYARHGNVYAGIRKSALNDLTQRILSTKDLYAKRVGILFLTRIISSIKANLP